MKYPITTMFLKVLTTQFLYIGIASQRNIKQVTRELITLKLSTSNHLTHKYQMCIGAPDLCIIHKYYIV